MSKPVIAAALLSLALALGAILAFVAPRPIAPQAIEWLEAPRTVPGFRLESEQGAFANSALSGRWSLVLFGFMHCADICPAGLGQMARLAGGLPDRVGEAEIAYVFVSVDPGRDTPSDMGRFIRHFDPAFLGVTGDEAQLTTLARALGVRFKVSADPDDYRVAHSTGFSIIDPAGHFRGRFRADADMRSVARELTARFEAEAFQLHSSPTVVAAE